MDTGGTMTRSEHLLFILAEECAEVGQRASKAARFGLYEVQPGQTLTNAERIVEEYADLIATIEMLSFDGLIELDFTTMADRIECKKQRVENFLVYSATCGTLGEAVK